MGLKRFVGRESELQLLIDAVTLPDRKKAICFVHDATKEKEEKGGIGKTTLLRELVERLEKVRSSSSPFVLLPEIVDFYELGNRSRLYVLRNVIDQLEVEARAIGFEQIERVTRGFSRAWTEYKEEIEGRADPAVLPQLIAAVNDAFVTVLQNFHVQTKRRVVCFLDSFEYVEDDESFMQSHGQEPIFPMESLSDSVVFVIAGRNAPSSWTKQWWAGKDPQAILTIPLYTFSAKEVGDYLMREGLALSEHTVDGLANRTKGRPILVALAVDLIQYGGVEPQRFIKIEQGEFAEQIINFLGDPLPAWKRPVLYMAHFFHRFDDAFLQHFFGDSRNNTSIEEIARLAFVRELPSREGTVVVLHDELRKLVVNNWWKTHDADRGLRRELSKSVLELYDDLIANVPLEERPVLQAERLHHHLFADFLEGFSEFEQRFELSITVSPAESKRATAEFYLRALDDFRKGFPEDFDSYPELGVYVDSYYTAEIYMTQGRLREAQDRLWRGINTADVDLGAQRLARLYELNAYCHRLQGDWNNAFVYYERAIAANRDANDIRALAHNQLYLANILMLRGELTHARQQCMESIYFRERLLAGSQSDADRINLGISYYIMGMILWRMRVTPAAPRYFKKATTLLEQVVDPDYKSSVTIHKAIVNKEWGYLSLTSGLLSPQEYIDFLEQACKTFERSRMYSEWADTLNMLARVDYMQAEAPERSVEFSMQALELAKRTQDQYRIAESHLTLAFSYSKQKKYDDALKECEKGERIAAQQGYLLLQSWFLNVRGNIALVLKDYQKAFDYYIEECFLSARYEGADVRFRRALEALESGLLSLPSADQKIKYAEYVMREWQPRSDLLDRPYPSMTYLCKSVIEMANTEKAVEQSA